MDREHCLFAALCSLSSNDFVDQNEGAATIVFMRTSVKKDEAVLAMVFFDTNRILALVAHQRYPAIAVLGREGLIPRGFFGMNLRRRPRQDRPKAFIDWLHHSVERFKPTVVAIAVQRRTAETKNLVHIARNYFQQAMSGLIWRANIPQVHSVIPLQYVSNRDELAKSLVCIFPILQRHVGSRGEHERYRNTGWDALLLALHEIRVLFPDWFMRLRTPSVEAVIENPSSCAVV